MICQTSRSTIL